MNVSNQTFYMSRLPHGDSIHNERDAAIDALRDRADDLDPESDDVSVVEVSVEGGDWKIREISGMQIAMELLGGGA